MTKYINGHKVEFWSEGKEGEKATICIDGSIVVERKIRYRHERTLDDHMGNTPCGYYCDNVPIPNVGNRRVYLH